MRRRFYELAAAGPAPIASEALERIAALYAVEKDIRGRSADERRTVRRDSSRPILDRLEMWLREKLDCVSQKSKLAEAIRYALSRWEGLSRSIEDGRIEIDSNVVERSIRPIALNRKNALFAGSDGGGEHWAVVASLIETCKLCGVEPFAYLIDVITRIVESHPNSQIDNLLPWAYASPQKLKHVASKRRLPFTRGWRSLKLSGTAMPAIFSAATIADCSASGRDASLGGVGWISTVWGTLSLRGGSLNVTTGLPASFLAQCPRGG